MSKSLFKKKQIYWYKSHTTGHSFKEYSLVVLVYCQICIAFITIFITLTGILYQLVVTPHFPLYPYPSSCQPLFYFLSLWICLFWTFPMERTIQDVIFHDWIHSFSIFSRYIHIVAWLRTLFINIAEKYSFI